MMLHGMKVRVVIEQPLNSFLYKVPSMLSALEATGAHGLVYFLGAFGAPTLKPIELYTTFSVFNSRQLVRKAKAARSRADWVRNTVVRLDRRLTPSERPGWSKEGWVAGERSKQKTSQTYPCEFVDALAILVLGQLAVTAQSTCSKP